MPLAPGVRLGPYEVVSPLGAGGMGEVYKARDPRLGRDVAIKVLPGSVASDPSRLHRFEQEARAVAALSHANILAIFDIGTGDVPFLVTELLEGETLRSVIERGPVPFRHATDIALQLVAGLAAAHSRGIVHRDVSPTNILLDRMGQVKLADFGIARTFSTDSVTRTGVLNLSAGSEPLGNVSSIMNAVQPFFPFSTFAAYVFGCVCETTDEVHLGPSTARRKSRAVGFVACQNFTVAGGTWVWTVTESPVKSHEYFGSGELFRIAA